MAELPYGEIVDLLKNGQVVPFLGAGVNSGTRQPPGAKWDDKSPTFLPKPKRVLDLDPKKCSAFKKDPAYEWFRDTTQYSNRCPKD